MRQANKAILRENVYILQIDMESDEEKQQLVYRSHQGAYSCFRLHAPTTSSDGKMVYIPARVKNRPPNNWAERTDYDPMYGWPWRSLPIPTQFVDSSEEEKSAEEEEVEEEQIEAVDVAAQEKREYEKQRSRERSAAWRASRKAAIEAKRKGARKRKAAFNARKKAAKLETQQQQQIQKK